MPEYLMDLGRWAAITISFICFWIAIFETGAALERMQSNRMIGWTFVALGSGLVLNWTIG